MPQEKHSAGGAELQPLFPPVEPHASGMLDLEGPHRMFWEESGNPRGVPVVLFSRQPSGCERPAPRWS